MACNRGGRRPGAGRPKLELVFDPGKTGFTPLQYMLAVLNNDSADDKRRDRMALKAAPYVQRKGAKMSKSDDHIDDELRQAQRRITALALKLTQKFGTIDAA